MGNSGLTSEPEQLAGLSDDMGEWCLTLLDQRLQDSRRSAVRREAYWGDALLPALLDLLDPDAAANACALSDGFGSVAAPVLLPVAETLLNAYNPKVAFRLGLAAGAWGAAWGEQIARCLSRLLPALTSQACELLKVVLKVVLKGVCSFYPTNPEPLYQPTPQHKTIAY
ncbi:hypothetical protein B484DRAFT_408908 [Ochromonadaceae sp. CCMP2298]|nr:hypothetical protein B484DRAFT_408908 [Ochromonadaceae sp. CCMP2298]